MVFIGLCLDTRENYFTTATVVWDKLTIYKTFIQKVFWDSELLGVKIMLF